MFCGNALQATLLHTRRFLSYHNNRFEDRSLLLEEQGKLVGLFPAAVHPVDKTCVVSHPGITYGGVIHQGGLRGEKMLEALQELRRHYLSQGFTKLLYKAVPAFYHLAPAQDDLYVLFRLGARRTRCDLSNTINLHHRLPVSDRRKRSLKKAAKAGVQVLEGFQHVAALWEVLHDNLGRKHGVAPVHTLDEISLLIERFPENIRCIAALKDGAVIGGTLLFISPTTFHAQYIAASEAGYEYAALDAVFEHCISSAHNEGRRWFDFGISTESGGKVLNQGLYNFKSEFGTGSTVYEFYELNLTGEEHASI
jgi:hypothetical protein